jgi:4-aminobutyrate aminotransferase
MDRANRPPKGPIVAISWRPDAYRNTWREGGLAVWLFDNLQTPCVKTPLPGPRAEALLNRDAKFVSPSYTRAYPLVVARGSGAVIEDVDGNRFLDLTAGIAVTAAGHCHPQVVAAIKDQADRLLHMSGTDFYYQPQIDLTQRLAETAPGPSPKRVFFTNSGAEALEAALKLARFHTGRTRVIAFLGAFHGRTYGAMSLSGSKLVHRRGFSPLVPDIHHVPFPRECTNQVAGRGAGAKCQVVRDIETLMQRVAPPEEVAAIFMEPIQGEGGYHVAPFCCLRAVRELCDKHGMLLVLDEVQCGMGRTGKMYAHEHWGIEPDIVCLAKGIASGMPLGAIVARDAVMDWPSGSHASTFGGNPVSCRAALATLELLEKEYIVNAAERGDQLHRGLLDLCDRFETLRHPRGLGLMRAVDVVDRETGEGDHDSRDKLVQSAFDRGLLLLGCGEFGLRFCPPLCISADQIDTALRILGSVVAQASGRPEKMLGAKAG